MDDREAELGKIEIEVAAIHVQMASAHKQLEALAKRRDVLLTSPKPTPGGRTIAVPTATVTGKG